MLPCAIWVDMKRWNAVWWPHYMSPTPLHMTRPTLNGVKSSLPIALCTLPSDLALINTKRLIPLSKRRSSERSPASLIVKEACQSSASERNLCPDTPLPIQIRSHQLLKDYLSYYLCCYLDLGSLNVNCRCPQWLRSTSLAVWCSKDLITPKSTNGELRQSSWWLLGINFWRMHRCRFATSTHSGWRRTNLVVFISCISKKILPMMTRSHLVNVKSHSTPYRDSVSSSPFSGVCSYLILPWREVCRGRSTGHSCDVRINWWSLSLWIEKSSHA